MNPQLKKLLLPFYFGSLSEEERLLVERELLTDSEVLVDYLDLKRRVESATVLVSAPTENLWEKIRPKTAKQKQAWLSVSFGAVAAALLATIFISRLNTSQKEFVQPSAQGILFDSGSELPVSSGVL